jgi:hypothetical protein
MAFPFGVTVWSPIRFLLNYRLSIICVLDLTKSESSNSHFAQTIDKANVWLNNKKN